MGEEVTLDEYTLQQIIQISIILIYLVCLVGTIIFYCLGRYILRRCDDPHEYRSLEGISHAYYVYRANPSNWYENLGMILNLMTCGLSAPWVVLDQAHYTTERFVFHGLRTQFVGTLKSYVARVCLFNWIISYFTCGLWLCCGCASKVENAWLDHNTRPLRENEVEEDQFYYFRARPNFCKDLFYRTCLCLTCQLAESCVLMCETKDTISQIIVFGHRSIFTGSWDRYWTAVLCPTFLYSFVTCGVYTCGGWAEERRDEWFDSQLGVPFSERDPSRYGTVPPARAAQEVPLLEDRLSPSPICLKKEELAL